MKALIVVITSIFLFQENHPPVVKIDAPSTAGTGVMTRYSISVSDKEDGDTKFDEINPNEILLQMHADKPAKNDVTALHAMMTSNCMNCHAFTSKLIGPSYIDISKKYTVSDLAILSKHVKDGSKGIWGDIIMPTHPELEDDDINKMVTWILKYKNEKSVEYFLGTQGSVQFRKPGTAYLIATYLDHNKSLGEDRKAISVK